MVIWRDEEDRWVAILQNPERAILNVKLVRPHPARHTYHTIVKLPSSAASCLALEIELRLPSTRALRSASLRTHVVHCARLPLLHSRKRRADIWKRRRRGGAPAVPSGAARPLEELLVPCSSSWRVEGVEVTAAAVPAWKGREGGRR